MPHADELLKLGAAELASAIAAGQATASEAVEATISRTQEVHRAINAVVVPRFDEARLAAAKADEQLSAHRRSGNTSPLPPLLGVPITIKECFHLAETPSCIGLTRLAGEKISSTGLLVRRLENAGAIIIGKTNVPQMMLWHECDNPVYGRTNNPWNTSRTTGGSTGGEGAIIAARGSFLGLGNDLGGSIRVPAHYCGIMGFKPTSYTLPRGGARNTLRGFDSIVTQAGPLARCTADLKLAMDILRGGYTNSSTNQQLETSLDTPLAMLAARPQSPYVREFGDRKIRVGWYMDDGIFPASPACVRAVKQAVEILQSAGCEVVEIKPPHADKLVTLYYNLLGTDGGRDARQITAGSELDWRVSRMLLLAGVPRPVRSILSLALRLFGQPTIAHLVASVRATSASEFWKLTHQLQVLTREVLSKLAVQPIDVMLCPPHALPAPQHRKPIDLLAAASYAYYANILGFPAGVMGLTRVRDDEQSSRPVSRDTVYRQAAAVDRNSAGMPVGVQLIGLPWQDPLVLHLMALIEAAAEHNDDYPCRGIGGPIAPPEGLPS